MTTMISPNFNSDYISSNLTKNKIDVIADRVNGWFLNWADDLNDNKPHAGFAVLHLAFSYFEFIAIFLNGEDSHSKSKRFFNQGFLSVFPDLSGKPESIVDELLEILYKNARCGFFHSGMVKKGILLHDHDKIISFQNGNIFIDRYKFVGAIKRHFNKYIEDLRNGNTELTKNFLKAWDIVNS